MFFQVVFSLKQKSSAPKKEPKFAIRDVFANTTKAIFDLEGLNLFWDFEDSGVL